MIWRSCERFLG